MGALIVDVAVIAACFALVRGWIRRAARLPLASYRAPVIAVELVRHPSALAPLIVPALPVLAAWERTSWAAFAATPWLRPFIVALALAGSAALATHAYNRFYRRAHVLDRGLLIALASLTAVHPVFVVPCAGFTAVVMFQLVAPFWADGGIAPVFHKLVLGDVMIALIGALYLQPFAPRAAQHFVVFVLAEVAGCYVHSAIEKLKLDWIRQCDLVGLVTAAVAHGWWPPRRRALATALARLVDRCRGGILVAVVALELAPALIGFSTPAAVAVLVGLAAFHLAIHAISGMNFLPWVVLNVALAGVLLDAGPGALTGGAEGVVVLAVLAVAPYVLDPIRLAWLDARLCNAYVIRAVDDRGRRWEASPRVFAPYDFPFALGKFHFLTDTRLLVDAWSETCDASLVRRLRAVSTAGEIAALERERGQAHHDERLAAALHRFLAQVLTGGPTPRAMAWLSRLPLATDWFGPQDPPWRAGDVTVRAVEVSIRRVLYRPEGFLVIDDELVATLPLSPHAEGRAS